MNVDDDNEALSGGNLSSFPLYTCHLSLEFSGMDDTISRQTSSVM